MGAIQSLNTSQTIALVVLAGAAAFWYNAQSNTAQTAQDAVEKGAQRARQTGKKLKKKASAAVDALSEEVGEASPTPLKPVVVPFPAVIPGAFDPAADEGTSEPVSAQATKAKKKKAKGKKTAAAAELAAADTRSESSTGGEAVTPAALPARASVPTSSSRAVTKPAPKLSPPRDEQPWTRVETRKKKAAVASTSASVGEPAQSSKDNLSSDAGITTSVTTGNSSPATEKTEDELIPTIVPDNKRTLAEKLTPKPRKTGVEDMLETPDVPPLAQVMRIIPRADEQPVAGFTWGDYEDVHVSDAGGVDADGEDDGWGVVKNKRSKTNRTASPSGPAVSASSSKAPESLTKTQKKNAKAKEKEKAVRAEAEAERQAALRAHNRELERARMQEQGKARNRTSSSGVGGSTASVDSNGKLVWD